MAIIIGVTVGAFTGFILANGKRKEQQNTIDRLQWQLDNEKNNARLIESSLEKQLENSRRDAKEQIEEIKADCEKRIAEIKDDAEKKTNDTLSAQEKRHAEAIKSQQELFDETMAKVTAQVKSATDDMLKQRQKEFAESSNTNLGHF